MEDIHEPKTHLSRRIEPALTGEGAILAKAERELGSAVGLVEWQDGWEKPLTQQELAAFFGEPALRSSLPGAAQIW